MRYFRFHGPQRRITSEGAVVPLDPIKPNDPPEVATEGATIVAPTPEYLDLRYVVPFTDLDLRSLRDVLDTTVHLFNRDFVGPLDGVIARIGDQNETLEPSAHGGS